MKLIICTLTASFFTLISVHSQVQTIAINPSAVSTNGYYNGGVLSIDSNSFATMKSVVGPVNLLINSQGATVNYNAALMTSQTPLVIAGPATIQIQQSTSYSPVNGFATFSIEPGPFPLDKTATIGANAGNVQVTMQMSQIWLIGHQRSTDKFTPIHQPHASSGSSCKQTHRLNCKFGWLGS